jgi:hypothetical protein
MSSPDSLPIESPLPRPPPGPTYVSVVPVELSFRLFVASTVFTLLVVVTLVLRVMSRFYVAVRLGWDDVCVFGASLFCFGQMALFGLCAYLLLTPSRDHSLVARVYPTC